MKKEKPNAKALVALCQFLHKLGDNLQWNKKGNIRHMILMCNFSM